MSKQAADFLRYLQTSNVNKKPDLPQRAGHECVAEWVSTASTGASSVEVCCTTWSKQDHDTIVEWLASHSKCPRKADIQRAFEIEDKVKKNLVAQNPAAVHEQSQERV